MDKQTKVLCLFDYKATTGFGTVSLNVKRELKKHFGEKLHLDIVAINYFGEPFEEEDGTYVISAMKSATKKDDFGRLAFLKILKESNEYDGIFIIQDLGVVVPIIDILRHIKQEKKEKNLKSFKSIFYFPIDSRIIEKLVEGLEFFDLLVTYNEFSRKEAIRLRPELKGKIKVIPHGMDLSVFKPLPDDEVATFRAKYFGDENKKKFIITNVNRNQPRKDIPTTIFAFIEAKKLLQKHDFIPFLYLHMNPNDPMGWDIRAILMQTDLIEGEDYMLLDKSIENHQAPLETLNLIYNASDLFLTTTLGEGWGLTACEASATKTPVLCPNNTSYIEIYGNGKRAYTISEFRPICNYIDNVIREQVDYFEVAEMIEFIADGIYGEDVLNFAENHQKRIEESYEYMKGLSWNIVCKSWQTYFKELFTIR